MAVPLRPVPSSIPGHPGPGPVPRPIASPMPVSYTRNGYGGISTIDAFRAEYVYSLVKVEDKAGQVCAIKGARATARVSNFLAEVDLELRFANETGSPMEAVFKFLTTNEIMYAFEVKVAGRVIKGVCKEKEQARREYDDAIASGKGAYLAEENQTPQRKSFDIMVGNLPHLGTCTVKISYAQELDHEETDVIFALPVTGAFSSAPSLSAGGDADELTGFTFNASIDMGSVIKKIGGYSELKTKTLEGSHAEVCASSAPAAGRLEVRITTEAPYESAATIEEFPSDPKDRAIMLSLFPKVETESDTVTEMIFLVDRSGSMSGKITQVRNAMQLFLRCMPSNTRFNIVGFGSSFCHLFPAPVMYSEQSMQQAISHVSMMDADLGGTELYNPLSFIMSRPVDPKYPRQIFVLTDGAVMNTAMVLNYVRDNIGTSTRIFTLGIGSGASQVLVQGIAHLGHGMARSVSDSDRLEKPIMALVKRAMTPIIVAVETDWGDFSVLERPIPRRLAPVFDGQKLIAYDFLDSTSVQPESGKIVVKMTATTSSGEKILFKAAVDASEIVRGNSIHRLAATSIIRDLEKAEADAEADAQAETPEKYKTEICKWALKYTVASKHTSFIAVENRVDPTLEAMKSVDVAKQLGETHMHTVTNEQLGAPSPAAAPAAPLAPIALEEAEAAPRSFSASPAPRPAAPSSMSPQSARGAALPPGRGTSTSLAPFAPSSTTSSAPKMGATSRPPGGPMPSSLGFGRMSRLQIAPASPVYDVVLLATANGSFALNKSLASAVKKTLQALQEAQPAVLRGIGESIWSTLIAMAFMEIVCKDDKEEWDLLYSKSKKFVLAQLKATEISESFEHLFGEAVKLFK